MSRRVAHAVLTGLVLAGSTPAGAQINFSNFLEARVGKDPNDFRHPNVLEVPDNRFTYFDQFNLDYYDNNLSLGFRFESFSASEDRTLDYDEFVHRYAAWNSEWIDARIGNYQAIFGRGLVLRAFELTGVVREELAIQFGDSRDLDGVKVRLHRGPAEVIALTGKPRLANQPPDFERWKNILVSGAVASTAVSKGARIGGEYLRLDDAVTTSEVGGGFAQLAWDHWLRRTALERLSLDTYVEAAKVDTDQGHGLYFAQSASIRDLGMQGLSLGGSWEYKDYQDFLLGNGVNEPPPLVREHPYVLLNRNTHVLNTIQEEGYQFESRLDYQRRATLILNWSRAENPALPALVDSAGNVIDPPRIARFKEFYAELIGRTQGISVSGFIGDSQDGAKLLFDRRTYGAYTVVPITATHSVELEYEQLTGIEQRRTTEDVAFKDNYVSLTYAWAGVLSLSAVRETSDNPDSAAFDPDTGTFQRRAFESLSGSVRLGNHHELLAFWGTRRGGLQCTAGTCYNVPAFDGVLMQLSSRF